MVLIPAGWAGVYRGVGNHASIIELAIVPFDSGVAPVPSGRSPIRLEWPAAAGKYELCTRRYALEAETLDQAAAWHVAAKADEVILVVAGALTLSAEATGCPSAQGARLSCPRGLKAKQKPCRVIARPLPAGSDPRQCHAFCCHGAARAPKPESLVRARRRGCLRVQHAAQYCPLAARPMPRALWHGYRRKVRGSGRRSDIESAACPAG
jgi:hypothetical protein